MRRSEPFQSVILAPSQETAKRQMTLGQLTTGLTFEKVTSQISYKPGRLPLQESTPLHTRIWPIGILSRKHSSYPCVTTRNAIADGGFRSFKGFILSSRMFPQRRRSVIKQLSLSVTILMHICTNIHRHVICNK
jgi:hypothetical protein